MRLNSPNKRLKVFLQAAVAVTLTLEANAQTGSPQTTNNFDAQFSNAEVLEHEKSISNLKTYLETLKLYDINTLWGGTHKQRLKSEDKLYQILAQDLAEHGINKDRLLKIAGDGADVTELLGRHARYKAHFEDYLKIAEIAVIARVGDAIPNSPMTYAGPAFFNLEISNTLSAISRIDNISVVNSLNPHHRTLHTGQICVFFLSSTYTKHYISPEKEYPNLPDYLRENLPNNFLTSRYPTYCSLDGETFSPDSYSAEAEAITRSEILSMAKTNP
jgi:hypothetical protein